MTSRAELLGTSFDCECGRRHKIDTRRIVIAAGALDQLAGVVAAELPAGELALVCDLTTYRVAGERVFELLTAAGRKLRLVRVEDEEPVADMETVAWAAERVAGVAGVVAVGSGTVNDLAKVSADRAGVPFMTVPTAASMNGYTSSIAALLDAGLKVTRPARPAVAVVADLDILAAAPLRLTLAGLGDVVSKPVCNADWRMSSLFLGAHYCQRPVSLIKELEEVYLPRAGALRSGDQETLGALLEALLYSGISMCIAGSSAPASGGEHLISHSIDMQAIDEGVAHDLHGAQVGVATCFMVRLYEKVLALGAEELGDAEAIDWEAFEPVIRRDWGKAADKVLAESRAQFDAAGRPQVPPETLRDRWEELGVALAPLLAGAGRIEEALRAAGAATHWEAIGVDRERFRRIVLRAAWMRNRYTLLHLARDIALLEPLADAVLAEMDAAAGQGG